MKKKIYIESIILILLGSFSSLSLPPFNYIIISYDYLDEPKSQDLESFKHKTIKIFIHGYLHLLGFNHVKNKDYFKMLREENFIYKHVKSKIN